MGRIPLEINMKDYFPAFRPAVKSVFFRAAVLAAVLASVVWVMTNPASAQSEAAKGELSNLEALLNITANSVEILSFASQPAFFLGAIAIFIRKQWRFGFALLGCAFTLAVVGLATPGVFNWFIASGRDADALELGVGACAIFAFFWAIYFYSLLFIPSMLALRSGYPRKKLILACNFLVFLPFVYPLLLWYVLKDEAKPGSQWADPGSDA